MGGPVGDRVRVRGCVWREEKEKKEREKEKEHEDAEEEVEKGEMTVEMTTAGHCCRRATALHT